MAKEKLTAEEKKRREALAKEEKIRLQKVKEADAKKKKRMKLHQSRINALVTYPYSALLQVATVLAIITFIYFYMWVSATLLSSLLNLFFVFATIYLGGGLLMMGYYFIKSDVKRRELEEKIQIEKMKIEKEEKERQAKELEELEAIEKELLTKRIAHKLEQQNMNAQEKSQTQIPDNNESLEQIVGRKSNGNNGNKSQVDTEIGNIDKDTNDYLEELLNSEFEK
ncbi:MAG: hypothetical protein KGZ71_05185 [Desulfobulbaceae bacterium]|nr:hypothetical protein [Candidatus Kapabacteria bacterium]MBS3999855.1 hypothetical protein [Desulfobulbaceae bacterium]